MYQLCIMGSKKHELWWNQTLALLIFDQFWAPKKNRTPAETAIWCDLVRLRLTIGTKAPGICMLATLLFDDIVVDEIEHGRSATCNFRKILPEIPLTDTSLSNYF